jgi:hypothetical protein
MHVTQCRKKHKKPRKRKRERKNPKMEEKNPQASAPIHQYSCLAALLYPFFLYPHATISNTLYPCPCLGLYILDNIYPQSRASTPKHLSPSPHQSHSKSPRKDKDTSPDSPGADQHPPTLITQKVLRQQLNQPSKKQ